MMVEDIYRDICRKEEVRANLIRLKEEIRKPEGKRAFAYLLAGDFSRITSLLDHEDPKVRKNAALILGELESEDVLSALFEAYQKERQLFVRADYLRAIKNLDYRSYLGALKKRRKCLELELAEAEEASLKHLRRESAILSELILKYEKPGKHQFVYRGKADVILICNRMHREITAGQIRTGKVTMLGGGIRVEDGDLEELQSIRTWQELLFPLHGQIIRQHTPMAAAQTLLGSDLLELLERFHGENGTFLFRLEYKGSLEMDKKGSFLRKTAALLEEGSARKLVNAVSDYEVEVRLVESKKGGYIPMMRLATMDDRRFAYRRQSVAASIHPVNAALIMRLAGEYLKENVQVLDPFCGVGTMLIERNYYRSADPLYGVDIFGEAVRKARENSRYARMPIHYINRDFFQFEHDYLFDEVVTDLPPSADEAFYSQFFGKIETLVRDGGILVLYSRKGELLERVCRKVTHMEILKTAVLNELQDSRLIVGRLRRERK